MEKWIKSSGKNALNNKFSKTLGCASDRYCILQQQLQDNEEVQLTVSHQEQIELSGIMFVLAV